MWKFLVIWAGLLPMVAFSQVFENEGRTPLLIELYTSEGCSSCPPADEYLGVLKDDARLWKSIVPLAFHVDYWDFIGWKDELGKAEFSQRQRNHKKTGALKAVYTPGWLVDGLEWRDYFRRAPFPDQPTREGGHLKSELLAGGEVKVSYQSRDDEQKNYQFNVALLGFDITNRITAGENRGETLTHQFVVLEHYAFSGGRDLTFQLQQLDPTTKQAFVVWVTPEGRYEPEQVASGWVALTP